MNTLEKIENKDPNKIHDDDHLDRKDISKKEFADSLKILMKKYNPQKKVVPSKHTEFSDAMIETLNSKDQSIIL
jgi:hypothetical protein